MPFDNEKILARHDAHAMRNFPRNYMAHAVEGGFYMAGLTFVSFETVLPPIIKSLGGPSWLIALAPVLCVIGISTPPLFTAHLLEPLTRKMPIVTYMGFFIRAPFLVAALALFFLADAHPLLTLVLVALAPFLNGLINGFTVPAWFELFAKTVPANRRASLFAVRLVIAGVGGLIAGKLIGVILEAHPGPTGYGILHLCAFGLLMLSYLFFVCIRETPMPPLRKDGPKTLRASLAEVPGILRADPNFRSFLAVRVFGCAPYVAFPFVSIHALSSLGLPESSLGGFFIAFTAGSLAGNVFSGYCGDKFGAKPVLIISTFLYILAFAGSALAASHLAFIIVFLGLGFSRDAMNVASGTLTAEIPPQAKRLKYMAITSAVFAPGMLAASLLGSLAWSLGGGRYVFPAAVAVLLMAASLYVAFRMRDPRSRKSRRHHGRHKHAS